MTRKEPEAIAFNIHAELYENDRGELAVRLEGDKVYRRVGGEEANFIDEARRVITERSIPSGWEEMSPRELTYYPGWQHVSSMGFLEGSFDKPALELEVRPEELGTAARRYLGNLAH